MENDNSLLLNCILSSQPRYGRGVAGVGTNRVWNTEGFSPVYALNTVFRQNLNSAGGGVSVEFEGRANDASSILGTKPWLAYWQRQTEPPHGNTANLARRVNWKLGGLSGSIHSGGVVKTTVSSGRNIVFHRIGSVFPGAMITNFRALDNSTNTAAAYDVIIVCDDGSVFSTTGTNIFASSSGGDTAFIFSDPITNKISAGNFAIFKRNAKSSAGAQNWDLPILNPACHNPADPDYPWISLNDGTGKAKLSDRSMVPQVIDSCVFFPWTSSITYGCWLKNNSAKSYKTYFVSANDQQQLPWPPLKATNREWPDPVGAGEWLQGMQGTWPLVGTPSAPPLGAGIRKTDFVVPAVVLLKNPLSYDGHIVTGNRFSAQLFNANVPASNVTPAIAPDTRYMNSTSAVKTADGRVTPMPPPTQTTLTADAAQGARCITVADASSVSNGARIGIRMTNGPWARLYPNSSDTEWYFTYVDGTPIGPRVNLTGYMPYAASRGSEVAVSQVNPGTTPSYWPSVLNMVAAIL